MLSLRPPRLVRVGEAEAVLRHAVGELMANNVVALREIDEDVAVAVTVGHLAAVPECVVVLDAEVDRGSQPHPGVVDRVSAEQFFVKLGDTCRLHEGLLGCRIGRSFGFGHQGARQCSAVIAIENRDRGRTERGCGQLARKKFLRRQREPSSCLANFPPFLVEPRRVSKGFARLGRQFPIARKALQHLGWDNEAREHAAMEKARHHVRSVVVQVHDFLPTSTNFGNRARFRAVDALSERLLRKPVDC